MCARLATPPNRSFFLLGPRSTGKTTWLRERFPGAYWYNLLFAEEFVRLSRAPQLLRREVELLPKDSWVIIEEVQKIPELLNEVHDLLSRKQCHFVLSGSSARKLRRSGANLLAGRALTRQFYPLVSRELAHPKLYFFDTGVVRALTSRLPDSVAPMEKGFLLETLLLHELRAYLVLRDCGGEISYWRSGEREVDFVISRGDRRISIEVKATDCWRPEYSKASQELVHARLVQNAFAVYTGTRTFLDGELRVFPFDETSHELRSPTGSNELDPLLRRDWRDVVPKSLWPQKSQNQARCHVRLAQD